jgi:hypothetical protein
MDELRTKLSTGRKALFALIPAVVVLVVVLIGLEIYVRKTSAYGYVTPEILRSMSPDYQPAVFARHVIRPAAERVVINGEERFVINSHGYRGHEFSTHKQPGTTRIMVYGGSSVFDAESKGEDDWPHRVERLLKTGGFDNVEVINAGIPGYSSAEAVSTFFAEGHLFEPDYVLLSDEWNDLKTFRSSNSLLRDFAREDVPDDPRTTYQNPLDRLLSNTSQLYVRLRSRYYTWKLRLGDEGMKPAGSYEGELSEAAIKQYELNIETFIDIAKNIGAVPIPMIEARLVSRTNTAEDKRRISYDYVLMTHERLCEAFDTEDAIIRRVAEQKGERVIDPSEELTGKSELFANHIHLNPDGSARLARFVAGELADVLRVSPKS